MRFLSTEDKNNLMLVQEEPRGPSQIIEVTPLANGLSKVNFPDVSNLRNEADQIIIIKAMRVVVPGVLNIAPVSGNPVAPLTELQKCSAVLYCEGWLKGNYIPLLEMNDLFIEGSGIPYRNRTMKLDSWKNLDWSKSFIEFSNGTVTVGVPYTFVFEVEYVKMRYEIAADGTKTGNLVEIIGPA